MAALNFPNSPANGEIYVGGNGVSYQWQNDKWSTAFVSSYANTGSNPGITPPSAPTNGTFWWDSTTGNLYTFYADVDSAQWISASPNTIVDASGVLLTTPPAATPLDGVNVVATEHPPAS